MTIPARPQDTTAPSENALYLSGFRATTDSGDLGPQSIRYRLQRGTVRVGSSPESDLQLDSELVSRQHALLTIRDDGVVAEDRGSTNGLFIDGHRIRRGVLAIGSTLRIGNYELTLERRDPEDDEVAIRFAPPPASPALLPPTRDASTVVDSQGSKPSVPGDALELLEGLLGWPLESDPGDAGPLLVALRERLALSGIAIVSWPDERQPVCHSVAGLVGEIPAAEQLRPRRQEPPPDHRRTQGVEAITLGNPPGLAAISLRPLPSTRAALLWTTKTTPSWFTDHRILRCIGQRIRSIDQANQRSPAPQHFGRELRFPRSFVAGAAPRMVAVYDQIRSLSESDLPVVLTGESGVGKEGVARLLHDSSHRHAGPFVAVNCAAIPADLMEAEMFGVAAGVATGVKARTGWIAQADSGTLFLDEIGEMPIELQSKLLRVLQEREVRPVGGTPRSVDVRLLSATNIDLEKALADGRLRTDLYYRLAGVVLAIPPLRQRREDLPEFVAHFLRRFAEERGIAVAGVTVRALRLLSTYPWPGNVRQLQYEMRRLIYSLSDGGLVDSSSLSEGIQSHEAQEPRPDEGSLALAPRLAALEAQLIRDALRRSGGLQNRAAKLLEISRNGLAKKMKRLGVTAESRGSDAD